MSEDFPQKPCMIDDDGEELMPLSDEQFANLYQRRDLLFIICSIHQRPGDRLFPTLLEYRHYKPGTVKSQDFQYMPLIWPAGSAMMYAVISIPFEDRAIAEKYATEAGVRLTEGVPYCIEIDHGEEKRHWFPLRDQSDNRKPTNVLTLQMEPESAVFRESLIQQLKNQSKTAKELFQIETMLIETIYEEHREFLKTVTEAELAAAYAASVARSRQLAA